MNFVIKEEYSPQQTYQEVLDLAKSRKERLNHQKIHPTFNELQKPTALIIPKTSFIPNSKIYINTPKTSKSQAFKENINIIYPKSINTTPEKVSTQKKDTSFTNFKKKSQFSNSLPFHCKLAELAQNKNTEHIFSLKSDRLQSKKTTNRLFFNDPIKKNQKTSSELQVEKQNSKAHLRQTISTYLSSSKNDYFQFKQKNNRIITEELEEKLSPPLTFLKMNHKKTQSTYNMNKIVRAECKLKTNTFQSTENSPNKNKEINKPVISKFFKEKSMSQTDPNSANSANLFESTRVKVISSHINKMEQLSIKDFDLGACKGEGRFGKVFPARHKKSGFLVGIKQIKKDSISFMQQQFMQEIKIHLFVNHPNIVKMYTFFDDKEHIYIVMEYMEQGSLYKLIKVNKTMPEVEASQKLNQICQAIKHLHQLEILHRDIKPENIVISNGVLKLCDFGWAVYSNERRRTYCGTLDYVCPEILEGESYDKFVDIWAIGVLAYQMLVGKAPFYHISRKQTMRNIMNCDFNFPLTMSSAAQKFIMRALQKNPDERHSIESLLLDEFLVKHALKV